MVPKLIILLSVQPLSFRAVLFRMVPKQNLGYIASIVSFRAVLFRMVPKHSPIQGI